MLRCHGPDLGRPDLGRAALPRTRLGPTRLGPAFACAPRGSVHAFRNVGSKPGLLLVTCTPAGLEIPFRAVRDPEPGSNRDKLTPEQVMAEFSKHGVTFVGPPLDGE